MDDRTKKEIVLLRLKGLKMNQVADKFNISAYMVFLISKEYREINPEVEFPNFSVGLQSQPQNILDERAKAIQILEEEIPYTSNYVDKDEDESFNFDPAPQLKNITHSTEKSINLRLTISPESSNSNTSFSQLQFPIDW